MGNFSNLNLSDYVALGAMTLSLLLFVILVVWRPRTHKSLLRSYRLLQINALLWLIPAGIVFFSTERSYLVIGAFLFIALFLYDLHASSWRRNYKLLNIKES